MLVQVSFNYVHISVQMRNVMKKDTNSLCCNHILQRLGFMLNKLGRHKELVTLLSSLFKNCQQFD